MPKRNRGQDEGRDPFDDEDMLTNRDIKERGDLIKDFVNEDKGRAEAAGFGTVQGKTARLRLGQRGLIGVFRIPTDDDVQNLEHSNEMPYADEKQHGRYTSATFEMARILGDDGKWHYALMTVPFMSKVTDQLKLFAGILNSGGDSITVSGTSYTGLISPEEWDIDGDTADSSTASTTSTTESKIVDKTFLFGLKSALTVIGEALAKVKVKADANGTVTKVVMKVARLTSDGKTQVILSKSVTFGTPVGATATLSNFILNWATTPDPDPKNNLYNIIKDTQYLALIVEVYGKSTAGSSTTLTLYHGRETDELSVIVPISR